MGVAFADQSMTSVLIITIAIFVVVGLRLFGQDMMAIGRSMRAGILEFKAWLQEIDDSFWRR